MEERFGLTYELSSDGRPTIPNDEPKKMLIEPLSITLLETCRSILDDRYVLLFLSLTMDSHSKQRNGISISMLGFDYDIESKIGMICSLSVGLFKVYISLSKASLFSLSSEQLMIHKLRVHKSQCSQTLYGNSLGFSVSLSFIIPRELLFRDVFLSQSNPLTFNLINSRSLFILSKMNTNAIQRQDRTILLFNSDFKCCHCGTINHFQASRKQHPLGTVKCNNCGKGACRECQYDAPAFRIIKEGSKTHMKPDCGFICSYCGESWLFEELRKLGAYDTELFHPRPPRFYTDYRCLRCTRPCEHHCLRFQLLDNGAVPYEQIEDQMRSGAFRPRGARQSHDVTMIPIRHPGTEFKEQERQKSRRSSIKDKLLSPLKPRSMAVSIGTPASFQKDLQEQRQLNEMRRLEAAQKAVEKERKRAQKEGRTADTLAALSSIRAFTTGAFQHPRTQSLREPPSSSIPEDGPYIPELETFPPFDPYSERNMGHTKRQSGALSYPVPSQPIEESQGNANNEPDSNQNSLRRPSLRTEDEAPTTYAHYLVHGNRFQDLPKQPDRWF